MNFMAFFTATTCTALIYTITMRCSSTRPSRTRLPSATPNRPFLSSSATRIGRFFVPAAYHAPYPARCLPGVPGQVSTRSLRRCDRGDRFWPGPSLDTLERLGLSEKTLVVFSSDNGPWTSQKQDGGSPGLFSGAKGNTWEGGMRVPGLFRWKGRIKGGSRTLNVGSFIDIFPTFLGLAGGQTPNDRPIDGIDLSAVVFGNANPERTIYYYRGANLNAVRKGKWKLHLRYYDLNERRYDILNAWIQPQAPLLFDLEADPSEKFDLAGEYPDIVQDLSETASGYEAEIERLAENQDLIRWFQRDWPAWQAIHQGMKGRS